MKFFSLKKSKDSLVEPHNSNGVENFSNGLTCSGCKLFCLFGAGWFSPRHPVIPPEVRCFRYVFVCFCGPNTEPQFRWQWMSRAGW